MGKKFALIVALFSIVISLAAQKTEKFSPEKFEQELRTYIEKEAKLTQQESERFFPLYKEMKKKQRGLFKRLKEAEFVKPHTEDSCKKVVQYRDYLEVELKRIQQNYHNRFLEILPASKVYDIIKAEDKFHRHKLREWGGERGKRPRKHD